jgi:hypothetical protein
VEAQQYQQAHLASSYRESVVQSKILPKVSAIYGFDNPLWLLNGNNGRGEVLENRLVAFFFLL